MFITTPTLAHSAFQLPLGSYLSTPLSAARASIQSAVDRVDRLELGPRTKLLATYGATTLAGAGIASAAGLVASRTLVPTLLHISQNATGAFSVLYGLPVVGALLEFTLSRGGVLGAVATSGVWLGVIHTLMLSEGGSDTFNYWALAHVAIGVAIAPLLMPGVLATAPILGATASAALLTSYTVTGRLISGKSTWQGAIIGALGSLALGPMGAQVAMGVGADAVIGAALALGAAGAVMMGAYVLSYGWQTLTTDETALLNRTKVDVTDALSLDMPGESAPGVFGLPVELQQEIKACELNLRERMKLGLRCYLFSGEAGTGKTLIAQGIARRLDAEMFAPRAASIKSQPNPAAFVIELFEEARVKARKTARPVVLFFDEAERLFENRAALQHGGATDRSSHDLVLAFNEELDGVHRHKDLNIIVIAATNHESALDPSIRSRFFLRERLVVPLGDTIVKMFHTQLEVLQGREAVSRFAALQFDPAVVARWAERIEAHKFAGRDIRTIVTGALRALGASFVDAHPEKATPRGTFAADQQIVWPQASSVLEQAVETQIERLIAIHEASARPSAAPQVYYEPDGRNA